MIEGKTKSGFGYKIEDTAFNDMRVIDLLIDMDNKDAGDAIIIMSKVSRLLLGEQQKNELYKAIANEDGSVGMDKFMDEMADILTSKPELKN